MCDRKDLEELLEADDEISAERRPRACLTPILDENDEKYCIFMMIFMYFPSNMGVSNRF